MARPILRPAKEPPLPKIQHPAGHPHIFFGEPTPGLFAFNRHQLLPPVIFRGFDLGNNTVSNGESLELALYWDAQRQLDLIQA